MTGGPDGVTTRGEFARELTSLREQAGLTVREVAKAAGKPAATVGDYFGGAHLPPLSPAESLTGLLAACGVTDPEEVERWRQALLRARRAPGRRPAGTPLPYRGLACYQPEDAEWFYGREQLIELVVERVGRGPLFVVGPSGSGKSSLLRAGVVPAVRAERSALLLTPGAEPLRALADRLVTVAGGTEAEILAALRSDPGKAAAFAGGAVVVVDQFEEVFVQCADEAERQAFIAALCSNPGTVVGLRADFYGAALSRPELAEAAQDAQIVVGPMTERELRRAIVEPARKARLDLEDGLVELILTDLASGTGDAGALPMLSHALLTTCELARRSRLTIADYHASGGIAGAVKRTAEQIYVEELDDAERKLAREVFLRLVRIGDAGHDTGRRVRRQDLAGGSPGRDRVLAKFVDRRLVTVYEDAVEISHEALITGWPRLRDWIDADRAGLRAVQSLDDAAQEWERNDRDAADLYTGTRLLAVREQAAAGRELSPSSREFLEASVCRERRRIWRLYQAVAAFAALAVVAGVGSVIAVRERGVAVEQRTIAVSRLVAGRADWARGTDVALAAQLGLAAYRIGPTEEARSSLINASAQPAVTRLPAGAGVAHAVAFRPDNAVLAGANADGTVRLWDLRGPGGPAPLGGLLKGEGPSVYGIRFSPDGRTLAAAVAGGIVRLWDVTDPRTPTALPAAGDLGEAAQALAFSPDGRTLAAAGSGVHLLDLRDPARSRRLAGPADVVQTVAFSPDGRSLAAGGADGKGWLWRVGEQNGRSLGDMDGVVYSMTFAPDGRTLAVAGAGKTVRLFDVTGPGHAVPRPAPLTGARSWVYGVAFGPDGRTVAAACADDAVYLWDRATGDQLGVLPHPGPVTAVAYGQGGRTLATGASDGTVRLWRVPGPVIRFGTQVFTVAFSPDGRVLAAAGDDRVRLWDVRNPGSPVPVGGELRATGHLDGTLAYGPAGRLAAGRDDGGIELWDVGDPGRPRSHGAARGGLKSAVQYVVFSGDGRLMAAGDSDGLVQLWDTAGPGAPLALATLRTSGGRQAFSVAFSPDRRTLAVASADQTVWLWDVTDPRAPRPFPARLTGPTNYAYHVAFSPDARTLAVASADGSVRRWEMTAVPRPLGTPLTGPRGVIYAVAFSPDGRTLASANTDKSVWLWDLRDPTRPTRFALLTGATGTIFSVAYAPDGHTLAAGSQDGSIRLWNTDTAAVARTICQTSGERITAPEWAQYVQEPYDPPC